MTDVLSNVTTDYAEERKQISSEMNPYLNPLGLSCPCCENQVSYTLVATESNKTPLVLFITRLFAKKRNNQRKTLRLRTYWYACSGCGHKERYDKR